MTKVDCDWWFLKTGGQLSKDSQIVVIYPLHRETDNNKLLYFSIVVRNTMKNDTN